MSDNSLRCTIEIYIFSLFNTHRLIWFGLQKPIPLFLSNEAVCHFNRIHCFGLSVEFATSTWHIKSLTLHCDTSQHVALSRVSVTLYAFYLTNYTAATNPNKSKIPLTLLDEHLSFHKITPYSGLMNTDIEQNFVIFLR